MAEIGYNGPKHIEDEELGYGVFNAPRFKALEEKVDNLPEPPAPYVLPAATASALGGVKQGAAVADAAGEAPTAAEFKALLDSLRTAGIIATAT